MRYPSLDSLRRLRVLLSRELNFAEECRDESILKLVHRKPLSRIGQREFYPTIFQKTAALIKGFVEYRPFKKSNKLTAAAVTMVFLRKNGESLRSEPTQLLKQINNFTRESIDQNKLADWIRINSES